MTETLEGKLITVEDYWDEEGEGFTFTTYYVGESSVNEFLEKFAGKEVRITVEEAKQ